MKTLHVRAVFSFIFNLNFIAPYLDLIVEVSH